MADPCRVLIVFRIWYFLFLVLWPWIFSLPTLPPSSFNWWYYLIPVSVCVCVCVCVLCLVTQSCLTLCDSVDYIACQTLLLWTYITITYISSVQFSSSVVADSLQPHELQHARPPCPSPTPGVHSNLCPLSRWCHPAISSSVIPFSSWSQSLPASESFPMS